MVGWPLEETLEAYRAHLKSTARAAYEHERLVWSGLVPNLKDPNAARPKLPTILNEVYRGNS